MYQSLLRRDEQLTFCHLPPGNKDGGEDEAEHGKKHPYGAHHTLTAHLHVIFSLSSKL